MTGFTVTFPVKPGAIVRTADGTHAFIHVLSVDAAGEQLAFCGRDPNLRRAGHWHRCATLEPIIAAADSRP